MLFYNCEVISSKRRTARKRMGGNPVSGQKGGFRYEERGEKAAGWRDFGSGRAGRCRAAVERGQAGVFSGHHLFQEFSGLSIQILFQKQTVSRLRNWRSN